METLSTAPAIAPVRQAVCASPAATAATGSGSSTLPGSCTQPPHRTTRSRYRHLTRSGYRSGQHSTRSASDLTEGTLATYAQPLTHRSAVGLGRVSELAPCVEAERENQPAACSKAEVPHSEAPCDYAPQP